MHFAPELGDSLYRVTGYDLNEIRVNDKPYQEPLIITPTRLIVPWPVTDVGTLTLDDLAIILDDKPQLILFGTGITWVAIPPLLQSTLQQEGIGVEIMNTPAACRTFNLLQAEGRQVAAALWPPGYVFATR